MCKAGEDERSSEKAAEYERLLSLSGVGSKRECTFESYRPTTKSQKTAIDAARGSASLWFWGKPGVGKSHLSAAAVLADTSSSQFWLVADLLALLRAESMDGDIEEAISEARNIDLLVLDDLGVERPTPFVLECLYRIIDTRCDLVKRTIVTSNASPSVVAKTLGSRIHSRLLGMCEVINIEGADGRIEGKGRLGG